MRTRLDLAMMQRPHSNTPPTYYMNSPATSNLSSSFPHSKHRTDTIKCFPPDAVWFHQHPPHPVLSRLLLKLLEREPSSLSLGLACHRATAMSIRTCKHFGKRSMGLPRNRSVHIASCTIWSLSRSIGNRAHLARG